MSGAMILQTWGDTMVATALLVLAVLLIRKPFARHFGPHLTYALWLVPALRLILPPLPFADPVAAPAVSTDAVLVEVAAARAVDTPVAVVAPAWSFADALPLLFAWFPSLSRVIVLGVPLPWVVLAFAAYPGFVLAGWVFIRRAERNEATFTALLQPEEDA